MERAGGHGDADQLALVKGFRHSGQLWRRRAAWSPSEGQHGEQQLRLGHNGGTLGGSNSIPLYIRWYSSQKVRQAMCRLGILHGNLSESTANEFLKQPMPDFAICISCPVMEPFNSVAFETLKAKTFLLSKKDKAKKIELKSYSPPKERQDNLAVFMFPRSLNDIPTVELADDEIIFVTETGPSKFRAIFKLARMVVEGKLDL